MDEVAASYQQSEGNYYLWNRDTFRPHPMHHQLANQCTLLPAQTGALWIFQPGASGVDYQFKDGAAPLANMGNARWHPVFQGPITSPAGQGPDSEAETSEDYKAWHTRLVRTEKDSVKACTVSD
jgi:hypothetical protein